MQLIPKTNFNFIKWRYLFFSISIALILAGVVSLILKGGPNYGIDFKGGTLLHLSFDQAVNMDDIRSSMVSGGISGIELQSSQNNSVIIRTKKMDISEEQFVGKIMAVLKEKFPQRTINVLRVEYVGPAVGRHLINQASMGVILSLLGIIIYVAWRFKSVIWGTAGVIALAHDVFVVFGIFSIMNKEITLTIVAALLTLAGYSINDTIVIFDRIRENLKLLSKKEFGEIINDSVNQTISRSLITSLTVFFVVLVLYLLGGEVIHDFAFAMLVGVVVGSYSTIYVASPMIYEWELYKKRRLARLQNNPALRKAGVR